jgi:hypothetical protein
LKLTKPGHLRQRPFKSHAARNDRCRTICDFIAKQAALDRRVNPSWALDINSGACGGVNIRFFAVRVMEKLGMRREGLLRSDRDFRGELTDEVVYGILRSEWYT